MASAHLDKWKDIDGEGGEVPDAWDDVKNSDIENSDSEGSEASTDDEEDPLDDAAQEETTLDQSIPSLEDELAEFDQSDDTCSSEDEAVVSGDEGLSQTARERSTKLRKINQTVYPEDQNLVDMLSDDQVFWVDGDSLLAFLHQQRTTDWSHDGQFLYMTYLAERFLSLFVEKGGRFELVFFQDGELLWQQNHPALALVRQALLLHFTNNSEYRVYTQFKNCWDSDWQKHLKDRLPTFLLICESDGLGKTGDFCLEALMLTCQFINVTTAFMSSVSKVGSMLWASVIIPRQHCIKKAMEKDLKPSSLQAVWRERCHTSQLEWSNRLSLHSPETLKTWQSSVTDLINDKDGCSETIADWRTVTTVCACAHYLTNQDVLSSPEMLSANADLIRVLLLHTVLLKHLPLTHRAQSLPDKTEILAKFDRPSVHSDLLIPKTADNHDHFLEQIQLIMTALLKLWTTSNENTATLQSGRVHEVNLSDLDTRPLADLMDGRLFWKLIQIYLECRAQDKQEPDLPAEVERDLRQCWQMVRMLMMSWPEETIYERCASSFDNIFPLIRTPITSAKEQGQNVARAMKPLRTRSVQEKNPLLPIDNVLVDRFVGDIKTRMVTLTREEAEKTYLRKQVHNFDELYHWHCKKLLTDEYARTRENISLCKKPDTTDFRELRKISRTCQKYRAFMQRYGESLEGGSLTAKNITSEGKKKDHNTQKGKKAGATSKKAEKLIEENTKRMFEKKTKPEWESKWKFLLKEVNEQESQRNEEKALTLIEDFRKKCPVDEVKLEALLKIIMLSFTQWEQLCKQSKNRENVDHPVRIVLSAQQIWSKKLNLLNPKVNNLLGEILTRLGFDDLARQVFNYTQAAVSRDVSVGLSSQRFQLQHMGHLLERDFPSTPDHRVDGFIPDDWQRELLNAVDNNESAVIVAPTSSGKTYASFYCMEKILREDDDGIVVYVSPTKALVNQVAATVYAKFASKKMPPGKAVFGVFTRDYRQDALNSQILVTVPQCLEILLLSPHQQKWVNNLRYIIFDEVHCLGAEIGAEVWEHLILMVRCPFLALSATIANPHHLHKWMQDARNFSKDLSSELAVGVGNKKPKQDRRPHNSKVHLVIFKERYADLDKFVFMPTKLAKNPAEEVVAKNQKFVPMHPLSVLDPERLKQKGFPDDLSLSPSETLTLYDALATIFPHEEFIKSNNPENYFLSGHKSTCSSSCSEPTCRKFITRTAVRNYEGELKMVLQKKLKNKMEEKLARAVLHNIGRPFQQEYCKFTERWQDRYECLPDGDDFSEQTFTSLMASLKEQKLLPAIVFSFSRDLCERLVDWGVSHLVEVQKRLLSAPDVQKMSKERLKIINAKNKLKHRARDKKDKKGKKDKDKDKEESSGSSFTPPPDEDTGYTGSAMLLALQAATLVPPNNAMDEKDLNDTIERIWNPHPLFLAGVPRGLSWHHAGTSAKQRGTVELLFRNKQLQLVTATGTLALGIHMPCKTVVLVSDSPYVTPLQFRQMSGRAGRRGYDLKGNVVFCGTRYPKIQQLISASIPGLKGNFPITVTLVLRLLLYVGKADDRNDAVVRALTLLWNPFFCHGEPQLLHQVKHHFLFSTQFLLYLGLVDFDGKPLEMTGLVSHLHYHEPSNFVFAQFLQQGLFHQLLKREKTNSKGEYSEDVMNHIVLVLCHLFARKTTHIKRRPPGTNGKVFLPALNAPFKDAVNAYNARVKTVYASYLDFVAHYVCDEFGGDNALALSNIEFIPGSEMPLSQLPEESSLLTDKLFLSATHNMASSTFASTTGLMDQDLLLHSTNLDLLVQKRIYADRHLIPLFEEKQYDRRGKLVPLNAYAYDFFQHGSHKSIMSENGLKSGEVFESLKDFMLTLKSISTSLAEMAEHPDKPEGDYVVAAFKQLNDDFNNKFQSAFPRSS